MLQETANPVADDLDDDVRDAAPETARPDLDDPALVMAGEQPDATARRQGRARVFPLVRVRRISPNRSGRHGTTPRLIVVHATESLNVAGLGDLVGLGTWFAGAASQVSAHVATDAEGNSARFVEDEDKAWHCAHYNAVSLGIEQIGRAAQPSWALRQQQETARWIAYWSRKHGIPIHKGEVSSGVVVRAGVIRHAELGALGGGHHDPGPHYPLAEVLVMARRYRALQSR